MSHSSSARSPFVNVPLSKDPTSKGKVPPIVIPNPQNMYSKGNQSPPMFADSQNNNEKYTQHSMKSKAGKVVISASGSPSLENAKKLSAKYTVHPSHRYPIAPQSTVNTNINASEGRKALRAFTELRQSAASLYPSTSKTSVFLKQTASAEELLDHSTTPYIHMLMSHQQAEASKAKEHKHQVILKTLPKRESVQQRVQPLTFSDFYRINDNSQVPDTISISTASENSSNNSSASPSSFSSARSENNLESHLQASIINAKIEELSTSLKDKTTEILLMKSDMKNMRATVEESSKEANLAKKLLQNFRIKISSLEDQMDILDDRVNKQETEIIEHIISKIEDVPASSSESLMSLHSEEKDIIKPPSPHLSSAINFDKILSSIADLNRRMDKMQSMQLIYANDKSGATFKQPNPILLTLYKNGIVLGETGFRSYNVDSVKQVLIDLCKGYFPSELYTQHPNGIFINVSDKRAVEHREGDTFSGKGMKLSELGHIPELNPISSGISNCNLKISLPETTSSVESLNYLVSKTSRHELIDIPDLLSDNKMKWMQDKIITLKLKQINNGYAAKTYACYKMKASVLTTVEKLTSHLLKNIPQSIPENQVDIKKKGSESDAKCVFKIDVISSAPFGSLSNSNASLKDYGIEQNTLLYITFNVR